MKCVSITDSTLISGHLQFYTISTSSFSLSGWPSLACESSEYFQASLTIRQRSILTYRVGGKLTVGPLQRLECDKIVWLYPAFCLQPKIRSVRNGQNKLKNQKEKKRKSSVKHVVYSHKKYLTLRTKSLKCKWLVFNVQLVFNN